MDLTKIQDWVTWSFRHGINEIFALLGYYAALIVSYWRFETTWRSLRQGSSSPRRMDWKVWTESIWLFMITWRSLLNTVMDKMRKC
jgi:hypothetical protein